MPFTNSHSTLPKLFIGMGILFMCGAINAQTTDAAFKHKMDSLKMVFKTAMHDTIRVDALVDISLEYRYSRDFKKAISVGLLAIKLAEKNGNQAVLCFALSNLGNIYKDQENYNAALKYHLASLAIAAKIKNKKE